MGDQSTKYSDVHLQVYRNGPFQIYCLNAFPAVPLRTRCPLGPDSRWKLIRRLAMVAMAAMHWHATAVDLSSDCLSCLEKHIHLLVGQPWWSYRKCWRRGELTSSRELFARIWAVIETILMTWLSRLLSAEPCRRVLRWVTASLNLITSWPRWCHRTKR